MRCSATGDIWVGTSMNLDATRNGIWFGLRNGSHISKTLQAAWNTYGESQFQYEVLEKLKDDVSPIEVKDLLKGTKKHWVAQFDAQPLL